MSLWVNSAVELGAQSTPGCLWSRVDGLPLVPVFGSMYVSSLLNAALDA